MNTNFQPMVSVVVIGRNEGERLSRCLESISGMRQENFRTEVLYVDSSSSDGSPERAKKLGAHVIQVRPERPCAAVGRNAGWRAAGGDYVLFLDGDTQLHPDFVGHALKAMQDSRVAVVWGHRREVWPEQSVYVKVLDLDWVYAPGPSEFCGGDALMRRHCLEEVGGFDDTLIAGEEPELCRRLRACGHLILHIDEPMTLHDLAVTSFGAYWKRAFRAGHAYAELAARYRSSSDPLWLEDSRRNLLHGMVLLTGFPLTLIAFMLWPASLGLLLAMGLLLLGRSAWRCRWKSPQWQTCLLYALHSHFQQLPIFCGQLAQMLDARRGRRRGLIDYKRPA